MRHGGRATTIPSSGWHRGEHPWQKRLSSASFNTLADIANGGGPLSLYLGSNADDTFVTVSIWDGWSAVEAATGGDVARPMATRHPERLVEWEATHFEIIDT